MTREKIIETAYMTIIDALDWGSEREAGTDFAMFVEGIEALTSQLLKTAASKDHACNCNGGCNDWADK